VNISWIDVCVLIINENKIVTHTICFDDSCHCISVPLPTSWCENMKPCLL
jgi:hypothetical protein